jgi:hypothetical protein
MGVIYHRSGRERGRIRSGERRVAANEKPGASGGGTTTNQGQVKSRGKFAVYVSYHRSG